MVVEELLFDVAEALRIPVLAAALLALALVLVEAGAFVTELVRRSPRSLHRLEAAVDAARDALARGDETAARAALLSIAHSAPARATAMGILDDVRRPDAEARIAKRLAEFEYGSLRRLERTRILVRMGPALGLMGTLIPLSPALAGLAQGDVQQLTENLRVAFSVTVAGLLVGAIAFGISLVRDRLYGQDYSDLEYAAARLTSPSAPAASANGAGTRGTAQVVAGRGS
ncbi:MAG TPA: MotA/TolQ/ExbB proton channel family protein [Solirubrobacterales bacterium]|jgi:biopolymer transport protein ExbB/TolQ